MKGAIPRGISAYPSAILAHVRGAQAQAAKARRAIDLDGPLMMSRGKLHPIRIANPGAKNGGFGVGSGTLPGPVSLPDRTAPLPSPLPLDALPCPLFCPTQIALCPCVNTCSQHVEELDFQP